MVVGDGLMFFDESYTRIGVKLSGGADSSIVYYMVCDRYRHQPEVEIYALTLSTSGKPYYSDFSKRVIEVVGSLTGRYPTKHYTKFIEHNNWLDTGPYDAGQEDLVKEVIEDVEPDIVYSGLTQNPDPDAMRSYLMANLEKFNLDPNQVLEHLGTRDVSRDPINFNLSGIYTDNKPFIFGDKRAVAARYRDHDMMEKLYPHTFSCEGIVDYKGMENTVHCGTCFFCLERYYGFGRLT